MSNFSRQEAIPSFVDTLLAEGHVDEARSIYLGMLERDARNVGVIQALSRLERRCGDEMAACRYLRTAAALDEENLSTAIELAGLLNEMGRQDESGDLYRQVLARDSQNVASHIGLGFLARARKDDDVALHHFSVAREALSAASAADPANLQLLVQLAIASRESGSVDQAKLLYQRVLALDSKNTQSHNGLAWIARRRGDDDAALIHVEAAANSKPADLRAQLNLASAFLSLRRIEEAKTVYEHVRACAPRQAGVRAALGGLARSWQDWTGALEQFRAAVAIDPQCVSVRLELGRAYCDVARWQAAADMFSDILDEMPGNVAALIGLAETAKAGDDPSRALALLEKAAELAPLDIKLKAEIRRLKTSQGSQDWRSEVEEAMLVARSPQAALGDQIDAARTLVQYGLTDAAAPLVSRLESRAPAAAYQILLALRQIERMGLSQRTADGELEALQGYVEKPVPGSNTLLLVFGGVNNRLWLTFSLLQRILRGTGASVVYVRDLQQTWYTGGIVGLGDDISSCLEGFRALAQRYGAKRILTLGNCVGCIAALRYGLLLGAEGVLCFHPRLRPGDDLEMPEKATLRVIRDNLGSAHKNVFAEYRSAAVRPKVTLVFGAHHASDVANVRMLSDVFEVAAVGIARGSADSVRELLVMGLLAQALQDFVSSAALAPSTRERIIAGMPP